MEGQKKKWLKQMSRNVNYPIENLNITTERMKKSVIK